MAMKPVSPAGILKAVSTRMSMSVLRHDAAALDGMCDDEDMVCTDHELRADVESSAI